MRYLVLLVMVMAVGGCTNVAQMQRLYEEGDESQLDKLLDIASRPEYPYATRRKAAQALGEIGHPRAVPVLSGILYDYEQRTTLKEDALYALGKIGDRSAVEPIGRMLDFQLSSSGAEVRMAALEVLGQLGGAKSAEVLVNALRYYDLLMLQEEQREYRGIFSGEEQQMSPYGPMYVGQTDSTRQLARPPMMGMFAEDQAPTISMFGTPMDVAQKSFNPTPEERALAHSSLVRVGEEGLPVIRNFLDKKEMTYTLRRELAGIIEEVKNPEAVSQDIDKNGDTDNPDGSGAAAGDK